MWTPKAEIFVNGSFLEIGGKIALCSDIPNSSIDAFLFDPI